MNKWALKQCSLKYKHLIKEGFTDYDIKQLYALQGGREVKDGIVDAVLEDMREFLGIKVKDWEKEVRKKWLKSTD